MFSESLGCCYVISSTKEYSKLLLTRDTQGTKIIFEEDYPIFFEEVLFVCINCEL